MKNCLMSERRNIRWRIFTFFIRLFVLYDLSLSETLSRKEHSEKQTQSYVMNFFPAAQRWEMTPRRSFTSFATPLDDLSYVKDKNLSNISLDISFHDLLTVKAARLAPENHKQKERFSFTEDSWNYMEENHKYFNLLTSPTARHRQTLFIIKM